MINKKNDPTQKIVTKFADSATFGRGLSAIESSQSDTQAKCSHL